MEGEHWTRRIPWWVKWATTGAFGIGGVVGASSVLPVGLQVTGLVIAGSLLVIAFGGTAAHLYNERRQRLGQRLLKLEPFHLIVIGLVIAAVGVGWQLYLGSGSGAAPQAPSGAPATATSPPQPAKFYSKRDKENLSDLCGDLSELLIANGGNGGGDGVYAKTANLGNEWNRQTSDASRGIPFDAKRLKEFWQATSDSSAALHRALYGDGGITARYQRFPDELQTILQDQDRKQIPRLQLAMNAFGSLINAIERAAQYNDARLTEQIAVAGAETATTFQNTLAQFQHWEFDATQRAKTLRASLTE
jgi:hypothetical protein